MLGESTFRLLNQTRELRSPGDWNDHGASYLWRYHLHYFDDLVAHGAEERQAWHRQLLARWVDENPPPRGVGWEPYPISRRIVNWIQWALAGNALAPQQVDSLAVQLRWLRTRLEKHLLGNHLLANAKALLFGGLFFAGPEADGWCHEARSLLEREVAEQILPDGGHFERSPMYHALVLEDLLALLALDKAFSVGVLQGLGWERVIEAMLRWLQRLCHPDGEIALFNDAAFEMAPKPAELIAYAARLGIQAQAPAKPLALLPESGYARMQCGPAVALLDVGPLGPDYLPGHGHADTLGFELSLRRQRVLVDSGTSVYAEGSERERQRGTAAHNTVVIDGQDSSETWKSFRVGRRARITHLTTALDGERSRVTAAHDGYRRLRNGVIHQRTWSLDEEGLTIVDDLTGKGSHAVALHFHLHPEMEVEQRAPGVFELSTTAGPPRLTLATDPQLQATLSTSTYHPQFGLALPTHLIVARHDPLPMPARFTTKLTFAPH